MNTFKLTISSPDGNIFEGEVEKLDLRGTEGELAIMAGYIPFITSVVAAPVTLHISEDEVKTATLDGGLLTVGKNEVTLLAGTFKFD